MNMKNRSSFLQTIVAISLIGIFTLLSVAKGDQRSYTPPPEKGDVYIIINKTKASVTVSVQWGVWQAEKVLNLLNYKGLILRLKHLKDDQVELTVDVSGGEIKEIKQYPTDNVPKEFTDKDYMKLSW